MIEILPVYPEIQKQGQNCNITQYQHLPNSKTLLTHMLINQ